MTHQLTTRNAAERDLLALYRRTHAGGQKAMMAFGQLFARLTDAPPLDMPRIRRDARKKGGGR